MIYPEAFEKKIGFNSVRKAISEHCLTEAGRDFAARKITFQTDFNAISAALEATAEMVSIINSDNNNLPLNQVGNIVRTLLAVRIDGTFIPVEELTPIRNSLKAFADIATFFNKAAIQGLYPRLRAIASPIGIYPELIRAIDRIIDRYGNVLDSASSELADIRRSLSRTQGSIASTMRRVLSDAVANGLIDADATPSIRDGRMVLPVNPMNKRKINGIVHDESASGKTVFIEPAELVHTNNRLRELQMEERREIARILLALTSEIRPHIPAILDSLTIAAELDFINAKALFAKSVNAHLPKLDNNPEMEWFHACHPGLLHSLEAQGKEIVPLDIRLTPNQRLLIVSGPNAGGKSVTLKTVGIIQYMAQCGILPPIYENSRMGIFKKIFVDIGDDQSIENDLSTYSSHLTHMKQFMAQGDDKTLVLIDEFGTGTEPLIGGAIAQAILARFAELKLWGVITTHYQNLKQLAEETPGLINGSMLYDRQKMQPMFRLVIGTAGSSFALEIARKIGLPNNIIETAKDIVGTDYVNMDKYLLDIARDRRYWENKRLAIKQKEKKIDAILDNYQTQADELRTRRREIIVEAKEQARQIIEGSNAAIERTIHEIRRAQADRETTRQLRANLRAEHEKIQTAETEHPILRKAPKENKKKLQPKTDQQRPVAVGDFVKLEGQDTPGEILEIQGNNAIVCFGMLRTTVKVNRLRHTLQKPQNIIPTNTAMISSQQHHERRLDFKQEIDVRGMRADEALQAVTYFIDDAIRFSAQRVRILHGTGTGALRQTIRSYLSTVSGISEFRDEDVRFGGAGITVVTL